jgi:hypothetical protein
MGQALKWDKFQSYPFTFTMLPDAIISTKLLKKSIF